ncbi:BREX-2 system adenine-specific DNA-methyltransferase PglX [Marisediminicola antarctica]|uniref:site-specific DNA-methyltransferase (adenine-specific) n=1 Tax=Marisediminicola antarctica TaxID=674079 RepID=A0A7L5AMK5_9MICO|nr:BREX-2 system adenine-specific DNA-methyltransferase PglX [Marisediminicola antarctica]QHO70361.1 hypothetical protein BHD05_12580 [Marisediminicola antarctica]
MIDSSRLLTDLKKQLKLLETDLRARSEEPGLPWAQSLRDEYERALGRERTALSWSEWRDGEVTLAAVAWIIAGTFIRFAEDNNLLAGARNDDIALALPWITGVGESLDRAVENQSAFFAAQPQLNGRDWLQSAFRVLASLPAGRALVDPHHNLVWTVEISATAADQLIAFWRETGSDETLVHDFTDSALDTRFLGDLYQDLSDHAKKTYALLQTPVFVEEFILDHTLTPALAEFGLDGLKLIDPTCGSGHFLLGAFERLDEAWKAHAPALDARTRVQKALDSIHGVDLNPFAVAIARFRLTIAALKASGETTLVAAPAFHYKLAVGDSLLRWQASAATLEIGDEEETFAYSGEDIREYAGILEPGQYHVVVGNPPYIQVKDKALNQAYRELYSTCAGKYALSVPFMELFFELARRGDDAGGAGYVGKITSNSFMKREFGKKLIEKFLSGVYTGKGHIDLTAVVDTSGAYIPGHGTPTVILFGRPRKPVSSTVRAALGVRGEPGQPADPANGLVWRDIVDHLDEPGYSGTYTTITDLERTTLAHHPWSLSGGGAGELKATIDSCRISTPGSLAFRLGVFGITAADDAFITTINQAKRFNEPAGFRTIVVGDIVRDYNLVDAQPTFFPYDHRHELLPLDTFPRVARQMWALRNELGNRATFSKQTYFKEGRPWYEWHQLPKDDGAHEWAITYAFVATHNHFALDRGNKVFGRTAPIIKLPAGATENDHIDLLGILNSSTACFWLKQVSHNKGGPGGGSSKDEKWRDFYEFTSTKLAEFPLPAVFPTAQAQLLDELSEALHAASPSAVLQRLFEGTGAQPTSEALKDAERLWMSVRARMVFEQEELDWGVYSLYGLTSQNALATSEVEDERRLPLGARSFEVALARGVAAGDVKTRWFSDFCEVERTDIPLDWPEEYRMLVSNRLQEIESNGAIRLLESPDFKRTWQTDSWEKQLASAARDLALDQLEQREYWLDAQGRPVPRSAAQLADRARNDATLRSALEILAGTPHIDLQQAITALLAAESVPSLAAQRYKPSGLTKFRDWQRVWELQRAEDRGEQVAIPVPPKYAPGDFQKTTYWKARGKLDVPKERFIAYPGALLVNDDSPIYGWAGWDHAAQGLALAVLVGEMAAGGATSAQLTPLLASMVELEPWLEQWYAEIDPAFGQSPAAAISGTLDMQLARHSLTRDDVTRWSPPPSTRGRVRTAAPAPTLIDSEESL